MNAAGKLPDLNRATEDWKVGDIAICVVDGLWSTNPGPVPPRKGQTFIVACVYQGPVTLARGEKVIAHALSFEGYEQGVGWAAIHFRKGDLTKEIQRAAKRHVIRDKIGRIKRKVVAA